MFCFSKGLCAPVGSIVVGTAAFISKFNKNKRMMGGELKNPGILAKLGMIGLETIKQDLFSDNESARTLGKRMSELSWI